MAEFVEKRCEDMIPELEQMERIKLFDKNEIRGIAKKRKEYEYKIQRHTKCKEDYLRYIQYEMDLLKLVRQRRDKLGIGQKKSDIDYAIANKVNQLYTQAIHKFQDDVRFWIAYMKFCKHMRFHSSTSRMIGRMLQVHQDKPKCWHIAARWEIEENQNIQNARQYLLRGLHIHPDSRLLYADSFRLELDEALSKVGDSEMKDEKSDTVATGEDTMPDELKRANVIYLQAFKRIKDIKFIIELLDITKEYKNTEKLQNKIVSDMVQEYAHEPLMWDTMAKRELKGLVQPSSTMEVDSSEQSSLRDRISLCNEVYQTAVKKIKTEEMWSLYIECILEINHDTGSLPNFKKKLLRNALSQAHQAKKLREKYYLQWINMLNNEKKDENTQKKLLEVLTWATEALPNSVNLWQARLRYHVILGEDDNVATVFAKATKILREKALPLWRMKLLHVQAKSPEKTEEVFQAAMQGEPAIARDMKPTYVEWLVLTKNIQTARQVYDNLCLQPPSCLELHKKMAAMELMQPEISLKNARRPHEMATLQFGKSHTDVWMDYINFEMNHGDPKRVAEIHRRAVKSLDSSLAEKFVTQFSLLKAKAENSMESTVSTS
ncbi:U3 small nucleolar RNA-associated protein 6 homolog [Cephus cinctus]|uniref:U3 small nucleolar RNA-associated protein 6 homolog n=1 Tax=Cephus cinctus TaxID=211228 RepID=A0AAJ7FFG1_CEPCN|nr:U3 small nucleolar RNA-associated protein 6 homolog [Cephus cinctus]